MSRNSSVWLSVYLVYILGWYFVFGFVCSIYLVDILFLHVSLAQYVYAKYLFVLVCGHHQYSYDMLTHISFHQVSAHVSFPKVSAWRRSHMTAVSWSYWPDAARLSLSQNISRFRFSLVCSFCLKPWVSWGGEFLRRETELSPQQVRNALPDASCKRRL